MAALSSHRRAARAARACRCMHPHQTKNPRALHFSRVFYTFIESNRVGRSMVPGTGLEPASQLRRRIFVTLLLSKPASRARTVRALDYAFTVARGRDHCPCALGAPRLVSTPSSRVPRGLARRCLDAHIRGFAEFEGFCTDRFRPGTQSFKSAMFTNFITPARGRTRFYHCLAHAFPHCAAPHRDTGHRRTVSSRAFGTDTTPIPHGRRFRPAPHLRPIQSTARVGRPEPSDVCIVLIAKQASHASSRSHKRFR